MVLIHYLYSITVWSAAHSDHTLGRTPPRAEIRTRDSTSIYSAWTENQYEHVLHLRNMCSGFWFKGKLLILTFSLRFYNCCRFPFVLRILHEISFAFHPTSWVLTHIPTLAPTPAHTHTQHTTHIKTFLFELQGKELCSSFSFLLLFANFRGKEKRVYQDFEAKSLCCYVTFLSQNQV